MKSQLTCSVEPGMLPNEYAVELETSEAGRISLFAHKDKVDPVKGLLQVDVLQPDSGSGAALIRLPAPPFEIPSQNVRVPQSSLNPPE